MFRLFACCSAVLLCAQNPIQNDPQQQVASAEQAPIGLARQWIKDPRPIYRAWAADLICRYGNRWAFHQELINALGDISSLGASVGPFNDEDNARVAILDAMIQMRVPVSKEVGKALYSRYPQQATILLYRRGCADKDVGTHILDNSKFDEPWLVAAQCLVYSSEGRMELLRRLQIKAEVKVFDPPFGEGRPFGTIGGIIGGVPGGIGPAGWPVLYNYQLFTGWDVFIGCVLLAPGRYPVYYFRSHDPPSSRTHGNRNEYTLEVLGDKLSTKHEALPVTANRSVQLHWTTAEKYRSDLEAFVADQQRRYAELVFLLHSSNLLTAEDGERCRLNLDIDVIDRRSNRTPPIPIVGVGDHLKPN